MSTPDDTAPTADTTPDAAPFPAFQLLLGLTQRVDDEERAEIDHAVSWLFMATASGLALNTALEGADDDARLRVLQRIEESGELQALATGLTGRFAQLAEEKLTDEEVDVVMTAAQRALPEFFAALDDVKGAATGDTAGDTADAAWGAGSTPTPDDAGPFSDAPNAAARGVALSPATMAIFSVLVDADPRHLHDLAVIIGAFAESYTAAAKRAKERGKPLDLTGALTRAVPHFPKTAPEMAAALLPAFAEALGELPAEDWTVTTGRRGQA